MGVITRPAADSGRLASTLTDVRTEPSVSGATRVRPTSRRGSPNASAGTASAGSARVVRSAASSSRPPASRWAATTTVADGGGSGVAAVIPKAAAAIAANTASLRRCQEIRRPSPVNGELPVRAMHRRYENRPAPW